ncbi:MAG: M3 family oligoendopeptidase [Deltaproteobacteria bacterium]|nr:M3 family oligoendopeptidase [Deltaproteobacteria bacterium]
MSTNNNFDCLVWDLSFLYESPDAQQLKLDFSAIETRIKDFRNSYHGSIATMTSAQLKEALVEYDSIQTDIVKPQTYAYLLFAADSENTANKKLSQRSMEFANQAAQELLFFDLELIGLADDHFRGLAEDLQLAPYRHYLETLRRYKSHTLSEREERLLKQKSLTGIEAFTRLFDELSSSFQYMFEIEGKEQEMTGEELLGLLHHPDAGIRERAFATFLKKFEEQAIPFASIINNVALDHSQDIQIRDYQNPMEPTHLANEVAPEAVDRLMAASENNYHLAREYFRLKARLLKIAKLKNTDVYAPVQEVDRRYSFREARELVLDAYGTFSLEFREITEKFFRDRRIDVLPRPGKSGGAFCMGSSPSLPPYVLLNFTGNLRDVSTLAHELGHGLHFVLAQRQCMLNYHAPLPLAETASVFGEMLLTRLLLEREKDPKIIISLLCAKIEDIIATTFRQNVLTRFEERLHLERTRSLLSAQEICDIWWEENARLYGDAVEMIEPYRWGWSYISHFIHTRFYCYSYTFAELLVLSLYQKYQAGGPSFVPTYTAILESGGSRSPSETVRPAGIDFADPDFWQEGYNCLESLLNELKKKV